MIRIGIVGHRVLQKNETAFVAHQCQQILKQFLSEHRRVVAYSAIAEGADSIFAEVALGLKIPLEIVLPFEEYEFDFINTTSKQKFQSLKSAASKKTSLPFITRSVEAYTAAMYWILENADITIAVWNGEKNKGKGGTSDAVKQIISNGLDWIHIDISNYSTNIHVKKNIFKRADATGEDG